MSTVFEDAARSRKVIALLGWIPQGRTQAENDRIARALEANANARALLEQFAGVSRCSKETWERVRAAVIARHVPGDGGSFDAREVRRPDFAPIAKQCRTKADVLRELERAFDAGVSAAARAVGL